MKINKIIELLSLDVLAGHEYLDKEISAGYCCDLLSWVMAHGSKSGLWITVQTHTNVIAVATLLELSCIVIPENIAVEAKTLAKAQEEEIVILSSPMNAFELSGKIYALLNEYNV